MRALALLFVCLAAPAMAGAPSSQPKEGAPGTNVDMPFLMAPMTGEDGKLSGYAYISSRLAAASPAEALEVRDRIAFIQDAFVRDVNKEPVAKPGDPSQVDNTALEARLLADARRVMGAGKVAALHIVQVQIAPLHPNAAVTPSITPPEQQASAAPPAKSP